MKLPHLILTISLAATSFGAPALADSDRDDRRWPPRHEGRHDDRDRDDRRHDHRHDDRRHDDRRTDPRWSQHCQPGLARKGNACVPPGQARHASDAIQRERVERLEDRLEEERKRRIAAERKLQRVNQRVGEQLRREYYQQVVDPSRYNLRQSNDYSYYQQDNQLYQVNNKTQQIMSIMNLVGMFAR